MSYIFHQMAHEGALNLYCDWFRVSNTQSEMPSRIESWLGAGGDCLCRRFPSRRLHAHHIKVSPCLLANLEVEHTHLLLSFSILFFSPYVQGSQMGRNNRSLSVNLGKNIYCMILCISVPKVHT